MKWPEYNYMTQTEIGWIAESQNQDGEGWKLFFKDPIMAESELRKNSNELGVRKPITVFYLNGKRHDLEN